MEKRGEEVEYKNVNNVYIVLINIKIYLQDGDNKLWTLVRFKRIKWHFVKTYF